MGTICAGQGVITIANPNKSRHSLSHKLEMGSPTFIEPCESFYSDYTLNATPLSISTVSEVWKCLKISNKKKRSVKIIPKSSLPSFIISEQKVQNSFEKLKKIRSRNLIKLYKVYESRDSYFAVTELMECGSLAEVVEECQFDEWKIGKIVRQILGVVGSFEDLGLKLYDLRPENLFLSDFDRVEVKVNAFNVRNVLKDGFGNSCFSCPEAGVGRVNEKNIVWSIGMIALYLANGKEVGEINEALKAFGPEGKDFIQKTLIKDANDRINIKQALNHPWIVNN